MPSAVKVQVRLDRRALNRELRGRDGDVGRAMAGFAGLATQEIKSVYRERAGGAWWRTESSIQDGGSRGVQLRIIARRNRPHRIEARSSPNLVFRLADGAVFIGQSVNHPGASPPPDLVLAGIERAGRRLTFTRAAPAVTTVT